MKWIFLLILLFVLAGIVALRYRRQINFLILLWKQFKNLKSAQAPGEKKIENNRRDDDLALARCARCGNWVTPDQMLKIGGSTYCSTACLEKNVRNQ